jgi:hypothetical protein
MLNQRLATLVLVLAEQTDQLAIPLAMCREATIHTIACAQTGDDENRALA